MKNQFSKFSLMALLAISSGCKTLQWSMDEGRGQLLQERSGDPLFTGTLGPTEKEEEQDPSWAAGGSEAPFLLFSDIQRDKVTFEEGFRPAKVTVSAWINTETTYPGHARYVLAQGAHESGYASYALYTTSEPDQRGMQFYVKLAGQETVDLSPVAQLWNREGAWHHVAGTFDGKKVSLYLDGVLVGATPSRGNTIAYSAEVRGDLSLGWFADSDPVHVTGWNGPLDNVQVWGKALGAKKVREIYRKGR